MVQKRLPSFNDFSPVILKWDLRPCLQAVVAGHGDDASVIQAWADMYFEGKQNKRSSANIPATLRSTGLTTGTRPLTLSDVGKAVLAAGSPRKAAEVFCAHLVREKHGDILLQALRALSERKVPVTKLALQNELVSLGIEGLSTNTTDHSTLKNWMVHGGLIVSAWATHVEPPRPVK